ncbi:MAG: hypothetical protein DRP00_01365 [Candidatus Aenigmatarchaeota archaeon]|nr:MAG: hypothetical protein DRP00_01365 [Candidatus Aenigmarchaeota archaeon]
MGKKYEVGIIGGGPAGSTCAYYLARKGVDVIIFDHTQPREKVCGGILSSTLLSRYTIPVDIIERNLNFCEVYSPTYKKIRWTYKKTHGSVSRKKFDWFLLEKALDEGAEWKKLKVNDVEEKRGRFILSTKEGEFKVENAVGAGGVNGILRKKKIGAFPTKHLSKTYDLKLKFEKEYVDEHFEDGWYLLFLDDRYVGKGYGWLVPKKDYVLVGLGCELEYKGNLKKSLKELLQVHPLLKEKIGKPKSVKERAALIVSPKTAEFFKSKHCDKNWVIIGEEGGFVHPLEGDGLTYAMITGELAAKLYIANSSFEDFDKKWVEEFGEKIVIPKDGIENFYNKSVLDFLFDIAEGKPELIDQLFEGKLELKTFLAAIKKKTEMNNSKKESDS